MLLFDFSLNKLEYHKGVKDERQKMQVEGAYRQLSVEAQRRSCNHSFEYPQDKRPCGTGENKTKLSEKLELNPANGFYLETKFYFKANIENTKKVGGTLPCIISGNP